MKLPGVISLRKALPICAMPNGIFWRDELLHVEKVDVDSLRRLRTKIERPAALLDGAHVGLEHEVELARLGELALASSPGFLLGFRGTERRSLSARKRPLHVLQSTNGSANPATWPVPPTPRVHENRGVEPLDVVASGDIERHHAP